MGASLTMNGNVVTNGSVFRSRKDHMFVFNGQWIRLAFVQCQNFKADRKRKRRLERLQLFMSIPIPSVRQGAKHVPQRKCCDRSGDATPDAAFGRVSRLDQFLCFRCVNQAFGFQVAQSQS